MRYVIHLAGILLVFAGLACGQTVIQVELAVPFGVAVGKLVLSPEHLIFIDDEQQVFSFALHPQDVQDVNFDSGVLTMRLRRSIRDRSGERSQLSFRMPDKASADAVTSWSRSEAYSQVPAAPMPKATPAAIPATPATPAVAPAAPAAPPAATSEQAGEQRYRAEHKHRLGSCNGQLVITADRVIYESVTDLGHSRQWTLHDIKEIKRNNPYELEIKPFTGSDYKLHLLGTGIDPADYQALVERITKARAAR